MKNHIIFILLILVICTTGCVSAIKPTENGSNKDPSPSSTFYKPPQPMNTADYQSKVTQQVSPTSTYFSPSPASATPTASLTVTQVSKPTNERTISPISIPEAGLEIHCLDVISPVNNNLNANGILVLQNDHEGEAGFGTILLDLTTYEETEITAAGEIISGYSVSPDKKWLAYRQYQNDSVSDSNPVAKIVISTANGQLYKTFPMENNWGYVVGWLDNQHLVIHKEVEDKDNLSIAFSTFVILDPFTGEQQLLQPDYPDIAGDYNAFPHWGLWGDTVYDPTLNHVVYFKGDYDGPWYYVLWDRENSQSTIELESYFDLWAPPRWSPDGSVFAFAPSLIDQEKWPESEMLIVDKQGLITRATHLSAYYPNYRFSIGDLSWSPNGKYIAFWLYYWSGLKSDPKSYEIQHLAILEVDTGEVIDFCIPGDFEPSYTQTGPIPKVPLPLWSPDSRQLVIQNRYAMERSRVILLDIEKNIAIQIAEDMIPVGWMVAP